MIAAEPTWHLVTCEYAPQVGGVADFTRTIAEGLTAAGRQVHVWSPAPASAGRSVAVHELPGGYRVSGLGALDRALDRCPPPRRLFVQWVPHGYGYKSLNVPFCLWVRRRAQRGDEVQLMVHEPFLPFDRTRIRQNVGAVVHRVMLHLLLRAARRVWVSTSSFLPDVERFAPEESEGARWLPIPATVLPVADAAGVAALRSTLAGAAPIVGYFGTCNPMVAPMLRRVFERLAGERPDLRFVLAGRGTGAFASRLIQDGSLPGSALVASGERQSRELSLLLQCCDVFVQPYHDGVSTRRTTLMSLLEHGRAVVTSTGVRTEEGWRRSGALILTPAGDPAGMASAALALIARPADREALGERARSLYLADFDVTRTLAALAGAAAL